MWRVRAASVEKKPICRSCTLKFLCGGGDLEHGYWISTEEGSGRRGSALARYEGQHAIYLGPHKAVVDEEGHLFPRGTPVEVCTDTASKLSNPPYTGSFVLVDGPTGARDVVADDDPECGPGCC